MYKSSQSNSATAESLVSPQTTQADYLRYAQLQKEQDQAGSVPAEDLVFIAADDKMARIKDVIEQIKDTTVPIFISGESGVGKEVIARSIHKNSKRNSEPFVAVNCAALPTNLLESELFGHEKGSFTGAVQRHIGKFEQATNGTLLLDEITEMDPSLQAKLLRALQEKEIERVGGNGPIAVNTRIIATSNRDIAAAVAAGQFRQDLYYRLHVIQLEVPALRDRSKDIEILAWHFLKTYCDKFAKPIMELSHDARQKLKNHTWPGNVRELQNVIQRAVLLTAGNVITAANLPIEQDRTTGSNDWISALPIGRQLREVETHFILETLKHHQGNRTHAAKTLGISLRTLRNKINEFTTAGIDVMAPQNGRYL